MLVSVDGYFEAPGHDISWHNVDGEFHDFANEQLAETGALLFGKRTYDMMAAWWPTQQGEEADSATAKFMNALPKVAVSHEDFKPAWANTSVVSGDVPAAIKKLKEAPGKDIAIFGSNALCVSLMEAGLVDEFRIMVCPVALGAGTPLFAGLSKRMPLKILKTREFKSGNVLNYYSAA